MPSVIVWLKSAVLKSPDFQGFDFRMNKKTTDHFTNSSDTDSKNNPGEFELIRQFFCSGFPVDDNTQLGIGDDASIVSLPPGYSLVQSIDTQVADVHFPAQAPAHLIAQRALRCAVSDLAAMGAIPQGFHLALTLPGSDAVWLKDFSDGLKKAAHELKIALIGGDTTSGQQLVISVAVQGWGLSDSQGNNLALTRCGARPGDHIYLSGPIGSAAIALPQVLNNPSDTSGHARQYYFPRVHLSLGQALLNKASACIDISDGLLQDAGHLARASEVQLHIDSAAVLVADIQQQALCLTGGDDYQLLFTVPDDIRIAELNRQFPDLHRIGSVCSGSGIQLNGSSQLQQACKNRAGFNHF